MVPHRLTPGNQALLHSLHVSNGATAVASAEVAGALHELLQQDVSTWAAGGFKHSGLEQIKERTVRRVFRGTLGATAVHIKVFRADTIAAKAKKALRLGKGEREAKHLQEAGAAGLPTIEPLAFGTAIEGDQHNSFLVTRSVASDDFCFPAPPKVAHSVGALIRRVHDAGIEPLDLHPGNVLLQADGEPLLCDLTSLRHSGELSVRKRAQGLAFFCNPIDGGPLDAITREFRRGYEAAGPAMPANFAAELARAARQLRSTALKSFGRRCMRSCKHTDAETRRRAVPWFFWHLDGEQPSSPSNFELRDACRAFQGDDLTPRRTGRRGSVWLTDTLAIKERDAGKARKLWLASYWLLFAKVPAAKPVALRLLGGRGQVFVERLHNDDLSTELAAGRLDEQSVARSARLFGASIGRLHGHGLRNRDLKLDNLVRDPATDALAMVDLDGVSHVAAEETRGCGRDLGRLLAAFRNAGSPGGDATVARFVWAYVRTRRRLLQSPPMKRILKRAEHRAGEWATAHD